MQQVADDLWQLSLAPRQALNVYVVGDVLVDAGVERSGPKIVEALRGRDIKAHAITHAHSDHVGGSRHVCDALDIPCWAPERDADAAESGRLRTPESWAKPLLERGNTTPPVPVARRLREGDEIAGFRVLETPGHSVGHVALWREADRALVAGDVFFNISLLTLRYGLREPVRIFTVDPPRNRASMRRLAALQPEVAVFGHGPPVRDPGALRSFVDHKTSSS